MRAKEFLQKGAPAAVQAIIDCVPEQPYHDLLELRYLRRERWKAVAKTLRYDERYVYKLNTKALRLVEALLK